MYMPFPYVFILQEHSMNFTTVGPGDCPGPYHDTPFDPRTPEDSDEAAAVFFICDEISHQIRDVRTAMRYGDTVKAWRALRQIHDLTSTAH